MHKIKVLIVDDHNIVRDGLKLLLALNDRISVCGEAGTLGQALSVISQVHPDLILLDFKLPDGDGISGCQSIKKAFPKVKIIVLTAYSKESLVKETICAGADGFLLKSIKGEELIEDIIRVYEGKSVLDPAVTVGVFNTISGQKIKNNLGANLSPKEVKIIDMVSQGMANKEIAFAMEISDKTVRNYISQIFKKLNVSNRTEAAMYWTRRSSID